MPNLRSKICKTIRDVELILVEFRGLLAELVFTLAAIYGLFHVFQLLTQ